MFVKLDKEQKQTIVHDILIMQTLSLTAHFKTIQNNYVTIY